jgi:Domain of unknown function (DUF4136)
MKSLLLAAATLAACAALSGMEIQTEYDQGAAARLGGYRTYALLPPPQGAGTRVNYERLAPVVTRALDDTLAAKGYRQTTEAPDFLVGWHATLEGKQQETVIDSQYGYDRYRGPGRRPIGPAPPPMRMVREYDEGTLILDIVDAESRTLIWRGSARAEVRAAVAPETREARVREAVQRILEQFPPK